MIRLHLLLILTFSSAICYGQDWESMDLGFQSTSGSFNALFFDDNNNILYAGGNIHFDGHGNIVSGFTKWNSQLNKWEMAVPDQPMTVRHIFSFNEELYFSRHNGLRKIIDDEIIPFDTGPNKMVLGSKEINGMVNLVGVFDEVGLDDSFGVAMYNGESFSSISLENDDGSGGHRLDDVEEFLGKVYVAGKSLYSYPNYEWVGIGKIVGESIGVVHSDFTVPAYTYVYALETFQNKLYIGGSFHSGIGYTGNGIQYFDGENMFSVGGGLNSEIRDMEVYEGELYVVGGFTRIGEGVNWGSNDGGEPCSGVAKWNGTTWTCLNYNETNTGNIEELEIYNDTLVIGGSFTALGGDSTMSRIARRRIFPDTTLVSVQENFGHTFSLFPNPSSGEINIRFEDQVSVRPEVLIYNNLGQVVYDERLSAGQQSYPLDLSLPEGIYVLRIKLGDGILTKKLVLSSHTIK